MPPRALRSQFLAWAVDGLVLIAVFVVFLVFEKWVEPFHRGFFCNDDSIRYPIKSNTISIGVAIAIGLSVILPTIMGAQAYTNYLKGEKFGNYVFKKCLEDVFIYVFGAVACQATCNIVKVMVGRLRPYFLAACFPISTDLTDLCANTTQRYITNFTCARNVREERLSFPSGHSSFIMFTMIFATLYLSIRGDRMRKQLKLFVPLLQLVFINGGVGVSLSRISDYKHHWEDVLVGGLNGLAFALFTAFYLLKRQKIQEAGIPLRINSKREKGNGTEDVTYDLPESLP